VLIAFLEEILDVISRASPIADENNGRISFDELLMCFQQVAKANSQNKQPEEGPDPKVLQFLMILEEYRIKCEEEGNYLEAARAHKQLGILRKQEEKRQQKVIQARHVSERQDVQLAHNMQFAEFTKAWDKYLEEYDQMAQMYIQQMTERHSLVLLEFQKHLRQELASKPPKWSRALLDQRRKQHINARNKNYAMAQKLKKISDINEEKERKGMEQDQAIIFARREAKFRAQQQTELQALLKRIECRRKEHIKQRELDTKRLLQRNRNVQAVLENKQNAECQKLFAEIKKVLYSNAILYGGVYQSTKRQTNSSSAGDLSASYHPSSAGGGGRGESKSGGGMKQSYSATSPSYNPFQGNSNPSPSYNDYASNSFPKGYNGNGGEGSGYQLPNKADDHAFMQQQYEDQNGHYDEEEGHRQDRDLPSFNDIIYAENSLDEGGSSLGEYKAAV
jgi:hypothetical protein